MCADNWKGVKGDRALQAASAFPSPPVQTQTAQEAFELALRKAGATLPKRDAVDARIVSEARNGTGKIINNEKEVWRLAQVCLGRTSDMQRKRRHPG